MDAIFVFCWIISILYLLFAIGADFNIIFWISGMHFGLLVYWSIEPRGKTTVRKLRR